MQKILGGNVVAKIDTKRLRVRALMGYANPWAPKMWGVTVGLLILGKESWLDWNPMQ